jgi:hypothetical protein
VKRDSIQWVFVAQDKWFKSRHRHGVFSSLSLTVFWSIALHPANQVVFGLHYRVNDSKARRWDFNCLNTHLIWLWWELSSQCPWGCLQDTTIRYFTGGHSGAHHFATSKETFISGSFRILLSQKYLTILTQLNNVSSSVNRHPRAAQRPTHATSSRRSSGSSSPKPHLRSASSPPCASSPSSNRCCDPTFSPHTKLHTGKDALPLKHTRSRLPSPRRGVKQIEVVVKHPPPRPPCTRSEAERRENVRKRTSTSFWTLAGVAGVSLHPSFFASGHIYGG